MKLVATVDPNGAPPVMMTCWPGLASLCVRLSLLTAPEHPLERAGLLDLIG